MERRELLKGLGAMGGLLGLGGLAAGCSAGPAAQRGSTTLGHPKHPVAPTVHFDAAGLPVADWVVAENAKPGTTSWLVTGTPPHGLEGFTDRASAAPGDEVTMYVNTSQARYTAQAYRMGWYQGRGGRLVADLGSAKGIVQPLPSVVPGINMIECHWQPGLRFTVGSSWPSGYYMVKIATENGWSQWVPLVVRDDSSRATVVVQSSVTTWQAYNLWGGFDLYGTGSGGSGYADRSRVVSFDRPYPPYWEEGSADFFGNEYPLVALLERHGIDVTYWTDIDLHARPQLLQNHKMLLSLGHDEYWSSAMRGAAQVAVDGGVNLGFLGANACYRHIRLDTSPLGPNRHEVCYKSATGDPLYGKDNAEVTTNWPDGPDPRPECELIGVQYQAFGGSGDYVVESPDSPLLARTGLKAGSLITEVVGSEFDAYVPQAPSPANLEILCHATTPSVLGPSTADMSYYTRDGGGGVFASGTASLVSHLWANPGVLPVPFAPLAAPLTGVLSQIVLNVVELFARGPASKSHPSSANWQHFYKQGSGTLAPVSAPGQ